MRRLFVYLRVCTLVWSLELAFEFFSSFFSLMILEGRNCGYVCSGKSGLESIPFLCARAKGDAKGEKFPTRSQLSEKGENSRRNTFGEIWASPESNLVTKKCALWSEGSRDRV